MGSVNMNGIIKIAAATSVIATAGVFYTFKTNYIYNPSVTEVDVAEFRSTHVPQEDYIPPEPEPSNNLPYGKTIRPLSECELNFEGKVAEEAYIYVKPGVKLKLYDGLPWECNNKDESYFICYSDLEKDWYNFYNDNFGHDYPNPVAHDELIPDKYHPGNDSTIHAEVIKQGDNGPILYKHKDVECMGVAPPGYPYTHELSVGKYVAYPDPIYMHRLTYVLKKDDEFYFAPAIPVDAKYHIWPGHCFQTFVAHDKSDYSWCTEGYDNSNRGSMEQALVALESGVAGKGFGTNTANAVSATIEGNFELGDLNGYSVYGLIVYNDL